MLTPSDHEPAPRALDLGAEMRRRRDQREADHEDDEREPPDLRGDRNEVAISTAAAGTRKNTWRLTK